MHSLYKHNDWLLQYAMTITAGLIHMYTVMLNSLGILLIARNGRSTRIVLMADRLRFSVSTTYSTALKHTWRNESVSNA